MLDIVDLYAHDEDPARPVICFDEKSRQLLSGKRQGKSAAIGRPRRKDSEYVRHGVANLFVAVCPKAGKRHVAAFIETLVMNTYAKADMAHLVCDNLNGHGPSTIVKHLPVQRAETLLNRIVWHVTPKHASWLNMAEIEISILTRQCLNRDMPSRQDMQKHVAIWQEARNNAKATINWTFTRKDAVRKFKLESGIQ